jgi:hypothetical protein
MHSGTKLRTPIQKFAVLCNGAIVLVVAAFSLRPYISNRSKPSTQILIRTEEQASEPSLTPVSPDSTVANRALFPYSVIPGGVNSALRATGWFIPPSEPGRFVAGRASGTRPSIAALDSSFNTGLRGLSEIRFPQRVLASCVPSVISVSPFERANFLGVQKM